MGGRLFKAETGCIDIERMKKLLLLLTLCAGSILAQNHEVSVSAGFAVPRTPTALKWTGGVGYAYDFAKVCGCKTGVFQKDQVTLSYGYTALSGLPTRTDGYGAHTALVGFKHNVRPKGYRVGMFGSAAIGTTTVTNPANNFTKLTGQMGVGLNFELEKGWALNYGAYGNVIASLPMFFSNSIGISNRSKRNGR